MYSVKREIKYTVIAVLILGALVVGLFLSEGESISPKKETASEERPAKTAAVVGTPISMISSEKNDNYFRVFENEGSLYYEALQSCDVGVSNKLDTGSIWHSQFVFMKNAVPPGPSVPTLVHGKDQIALVNATYLYCIPVIEEGFTIPYLIHSDEETIYSIEPIRRSEVWISSSIDVEEINGVSPKEFISRLSKTNDGILTASYDAEYSFGRFEGTNWVSDTVKADYWYFLIEDYTNFNYYMELPIETTRDGYYLADYSELAEGRYIFFNTSLTGTFFVADVK